MKKFCFTLHWGQKGGCRALLRRLCQAAAGRKKALAAAALALLACLAAGAAVGRALARPAGCTVGDLAGQALFAAAPAQEEGQGEKVVYLTFDDGPSATTEDILDTLQEQAVPATFFVIAAENNEKYLPVLARTVAEGHLVGLHSASHEYKEIYRSPEAFWQDIDALRAAIAPYVPGPCTCLRFPGGSTNTVSRKYGGSDIMKRLKQQAAEKGYTCVDWNVCAGDAVGGRPSAQELYDNVVREAAGHDTCVVLMHDTAVTKNTARALPDIIRWFKNAGYRFDTVDHLGNFT